MPILLMMVLWTLALAGPAGAQLLDAGVDEPSAGVTPEKLAVKLPPPADPQIWVQRADGHIDSVRASKLYDACPSCVRFGSMYYESVVDANRLVVQACAASSRGKSGSADRTTYDKCRTLPVLDIDIPVSNRVKYRIWNDGVIHVWYNLRLEFGDKILGEKMTDMMLSEARECAARIGEFWGRYGLDLKINVDSEERPSFTPDNSVTVYLRDGRANSATFYWDTQHGYILNMRSYCRKKYGRSDRFEKCLTNVRASRKEDFCLTMLHETGHQLGLPDEYEDKDKCPDRDFVATEADPTSVMNDHDPGWDAIEFFPRHLNTVLKPICGD